MPSRKPAIKKPSGTPRKRRGVKIRPTDLLPADLALPADGTQPAAVAELAEGVRADGGAVLATYREPLGGHTLASVEQSAIKQTLVLTRGNKVHAARMLGIAASTLYEKLKKYSL